MPNRIRELREERNMTQVRLSIELEVTQETISAYEIGKHQPSIKSLLKMSDLFHVSIDYILGRSNVRNPVSNSSALPANQQLYSIFQSLDQSQQALSIAYMQGLIDSTK